jgi:hypothetical protein
MTRIKLKQPELPAAVKQGVSSDDRERWQDINTAFVTYFGNFVVGSKSRHVRRLLDQTFDAPHASSKQQRLMAVLRARNNLDEESVSTCNILEATLAAQRSHMQWRVPMFDELAARLDQDPDYRQRETALHRDPDLGAVHLRRIQVCRMAHVVEMSLDLPVPEPLAYTTYHEPRFAED